jgi:hypothetical protein
VSGRLRVVGRTSAERLRASFREPGGPSGPPSKRITQRRRVRPRGGRERSGHAGEIPCVGSVRGRHRTPVLRGERSGLSQRRVTNGGAHMAVKALRRTLGCGNAPRRLFRRVALPCSPPPRRWRAWWQRSPGAAGSSRGASRAPGRVSFGRRIRRDPSPGFVSRCHGRSGRGVSTEAVTARGNQASRGVRLLEGETL